MNSRLANRPMFHGSPRALQRAFTLIELLIAVVILSVIGAIAMPMYSSYIQTGEEGVLLTNMSTIEVFQEDFRLRTGAYAVNLADKAAIEAAIGWAPRDSAEFTYSIAAGDGTTYSLTGTDGNGNTRCIVYPAGTPCP